jgi:hypothetical protein
MDQYEKIVCGKFDDNIYIDINHIKNEKVRIGSKNPNTLTTPIFEPISTNGQVILYDNKTHNIREFLANTDRNILNNLIVLTIRERDMILEELVDFDLDINVFEIKYPIFNHIKYISNIYKNFEELNKLLNQVNQFDVKGKSLAHNLSTRYSFNVERKLRFKNKFDYFFAFAYKGGYSEVFKLKEERSDRLIIAFDYNSMYVDSMMGKFLEPKSIKYKNLREENTHIAQLDNGLYRVIFKNAKDTFFKQYHPFKYMKLNHSFYFNLEQHQHIELLLFKNEIIYYSKFFDDIEILEGFYTKKEIVHPLKEYALSIYNDRLKYKAAGDQLMNDFCKYKLITIHSSTNTKRFKNLYFRTIKDIISYLSTNYMISFPTYLKDTEKLALFDDKKYFTFIKHKNGYKAKIINFDTNESVFSISAQIIANARIKMIQTIEKFLQHNSVEICYINIDSIHISILKTEVDNFLEKHNEIISNKLGDLKIESISEKGYWFDIGRYWLISNKNIDLFKNTIFNRKGNHQNFVKSSKLKFISKGSIFNFVKVAYTSIYNAFSYHKKVIDNDNYKRYTFSEINNLDVASDSFDKEILNSKKIKKNLFNRIATVKV